MKDTQLSENTTVEQYQQSEKNNDRQALAKFIRERFNERYFNPIDATPRANKNGFTIMAVCCLVIETLESFYQGRGDTRNHSGEMFCCFFARDAPLKVFASGDNWFYKDIRCGLLHQSEARNGWRIRRDGPLLDKTTKCINATTFMCELRSAVDTYADELLHNDERLILFKKKMKVVCDNCA